MTNDGLMRFQVSERQDDWSRAVLVQAGDIGEALDEYLRIMEAQWAAGKASRPAPGQRLYVREPGDDQVYEFATSTDWQSREGIEIEEEEDGEE